MDLSWATIHASLEMFNMETIDDYSKRIFEYASRKNDDFSISFLASCCSHTMHRFTKGIKRNVKFDDKECRTFAILCFSLLLNTLDLQSSKDIFQLMCIVFLNNKYSQNVQKAKYCLYQSYLLINLNVIYLRQCLQDLIAQRPEEASEIKKIIDDIFKEIDTTEEENADFIEDNTEGNK